MIQIYTDGHHDKNKTDAGGWSFVVTLNDKELHRNSGGIVGTTNNRMELTAVMKAIDWAGSQSEDEFEIISDAKYVTDAVNKGWFRSWIAKNDSARSNLDLWMSFNALYKKVTDVKTIHISWVKAHSGHLWNDLADMLAKAAGKTAYLNYLKLAEDINADKGIYPSREKIQSLLDHATGEKYYQFPIIMVFIKCFYDIDIKIAATYEDKKDEIVYDQQVTIGRLYMTKSKIDENTVDNISSFLKKCAKTHRSNNQSTLLRANKILENFNELVLL